MPPPNPLGDELRLQLLPGGCLQLEGAASAPMLARHLLMALGISTVLNGRHVAVIDWLPGLDWHVQVSQALADSLSGMSDGELWSRLGPPITAWLDGPADAGVFWMPREWGEGALVPRNCRLGTEPPIYTLRCQWRGALGWRAG